MCVSQCVASISVVIIWLNKMQLCYNKEKCAFYFNLSHAFYR